MRKIVSMAATTVVTMIALLVWHFAAHAHDHGRPELNSWFEGLKSGKGPCCSGADGTALRSGNRLRSAPAYRPRPASARPRRASRRDQGI